MSEDPVHPSGDDLLFVAIDALPNQTERAECLLRMAVGEPIEHEYRAGHLINSDGACIGSGCEVRTPDVSPTGEDKARLNELENAVMEQWLETVCGKTQCPAHLEAIEQEQPSYSECPICSGTPGGTMTCRECGMPLGL